MNFVDRLVAPVSTSARARLGIDLLECGRAAEGFRHLAHAARNGCIEAQYRVGRCYLEGTGVPQATAEAVRWLERAAEAGSLDAQFYLALLYARGVSAPSGGNPGREGPLYSRRYKRRTGFHHGTQVGAPRR